MVSYGSCTPVPAPIERVLYCIVLYYAVLYCTVLYYAVLCTLYCTVMFPGYRSELYSRPCPHSLITAEQRAELTKETGERNISKIFIYFK